MKERKRLVLKLHQDGRDEKKMPRYAESVIDVTFQL